MYRLAQTFPLLLQHNNEVTMMPALWIHPVINIFDMHDMVRCNIPHQKSLQGPAKQATRAIAALQHNFRLALKTASHAVAKR
ncbi:MAG: hypothetical protein ACJ8HI_01355 [Massilia sp.]